MDKLTKVNKRAKKYGYGVILPSTRKDKKYMTTYRGRIIHFGAKGYEDYLDHGDEQRRENYRRRHRGVKNKDGKEAYRVRGTPAHLSYFLIW